MSDLKNKRIICVAVVGAMASRNENPNVPYTPEEIAASVYESWKAGAAVAHIHVRNDDGTATIEYSRYKETIDRIRAYKDCDICLNITTSGKTSGTDEDRMEAALGLLPEIASYDCGSMNWAHAAIFENHPRFLEKLGLALQEAEIKPEIEIFDAGMIYNAMYYMKKGILKAPCHFQFVMGAPGGVNNDLRHLLYLRDLIPESSTWSACGIGSGHMPVMLATIALGGHLRVGMEDNVMYHRGVPAESNAQFVARAKRLIEEAGFEAATPDEARAIMGLKRKVF